jgi:hypothetical protein
MGLIVTLLVCGRSIAHAQQTIEIPPPVSQVQPHIHFKPKPTASAIAPPVERYDETPPTPALPTPPQPTSEPPPEVQPTPQASQNQQPVLPAIFRGCWQGVVQFVDSIERLPGATKIGTWTPKTYRLCYERYGSGPFQLTFTEAGIEHSRKITNSQGVMNLESTDGRTFATMRSQLHFDEYRNGDNSSDETFAVDEATRLQCEIQPDGMHVIGSVRGTRDGAPWFRAYWHAVFIHVPG